MIQRVNTKLGLAWYPKDWWNSKAFHSMRNKPKLQLAYLSVLWYITIEGGETTITKEIVSHLTGCKKLQPGTWSELVQNFTIGTNQKWSHPSITKRIQKAKRISETNKSKWIGRYQNGKDNTKLFQRTDDNPIKGGRAEESPTPPIEKTNENELPEWARPETYTQ